MVISHNRGNGRAGDGGQIFHPISMTGEYFLRDPQIANHGQGSVSHGNTANRIKQMVNTLAWVGLTDEKHLQWLVARYGCG